MGCIYREERVSAVVVGGLQLLQGLGAFLLIATNDENGWGRDSTSQLNGGASSDTASTSNEDRHHVRASSLQGRIPVADLGKCLSHGDEWSIDKRRRQISSKSLDAERGDVE